MRTAGRVTQFDSTEQLEKLAMNASVKMKFPNLPLYVVGHLKKSGGEVRAQQLGRRYTYWAYLPKGSMLDPREANKTVAIMEEEFEEWKQARDIK